MNIFYPVQICVRIDRVSVWIFDGDKNQPEIEMETRDNECGKSNFKANQKALSSWWQVYFSTGWCGWNFCRV